MNVLRIFYQALFWLFLTPVIRRAMAGRRAPSDAFVSMWLMLAMGTSLFGLMAVVGVVWAYPVFGLGVVLLMPWVIARRVFIPLGMSRTARRLSGLSGWTWGEDRQGGALVAGAWALLRQRTPDRARMTELEWLRDGHNRLTAANVLATGLLAAARGDSASARMLIKSVDEIGLQTTANAVHALAREWLVVDAAERGRWADVVRLAGGERARTRMTKLLCKVGACLSGRADAPTKQLLWTLWLFTGKRRHTYALVKRAAAVAAQHGQTPSPLDRRLATTIRPDFFQDALSAHVYALARDASRLEASDIARLADVWDSALADPETHALVLSRARILGARDGEGAWRSLADDVSHDLANLARAAGVTLAEHASQSSVLGDAQLWLRNDLIGEIELAFDALSARAQDRRSLSSMDEWREFLSLRAVYLRAVGLGGIGLRRLAFPHVHHTVCKLAVWLWNDRREQLMANAMFRWLLQEAKLVGDSEAIELQNRNWDREL
jgi:hypothetical protein